MNQTSLLPPRLIHAGIYFLLLEFLFQFVFNRTIAPNTIVETLSLGICYTLLFIMALRTSLLVLSISYLFLPLVIFCIGWLNWYIALPFLAIIFFCLGRFTAKELIITADSITWQLIISFGLLIAWAHLSGAGGFGYQSVDYLMHNGRLHDLVFYSWPISYKEVFHDWPIAYEENKNLVFYLSYYLPAALLGKILGYHFASLAQYLWMVMGLFISFRWLVFFTKTQFFIALAGVFILFGGWDIFGALLAGDSFSGLLDGTDRSIQRIDIWSMNLLGSHYLWLYPSNTFQLFYAPHQIIAGWIIVSLQSHLFFKKKYGLFFFITAGYAFWSPMMLLMMMPICMAMLVVVERNALTDFISFENTVGAGAIIALFACYYLSGSAMSIPSLVLWKDPDAVKNIFKLPLLFIIPCGAYASILLFFGGKYFSPQEFRWVKIVLFALIVALLYRYGEYNDFMLRGVAPLMFVVLFSLIILFNRLLLDKRYIIALFLAFIFLPGMGSALVLMHNSVSNYHAERPAISVKDYFSFNYEQLGRDDSFFFKYLAKNH